jgi:hypothetical protein
MGTNTTTKTTIGKGAIGGDKGWSEKFTIVDAVGGNNSQRKGRGVRFAVRQRSLGLRTERLLTKCTENGGVCVEVLAQ